MPTPKQGGVYYIPQILPPQGNRANPKNHYFVCLMNSNHIGSYQHPSKNPFFSVLGCIIRSQVNTETGKKVGLIQSYSFPILASDYSFLKHDSIVETHQLFHVHYPVFEDPNTQCIGSLYMPNDKNDPQLMSEILEAAQSLFI